MSDPEIDAIRTVLTSRPRPSGLAERRDRLDGLGRNYPTPADIRLEPVTANGVPAEWSTSPTADPARAILFLHGGGYISGSIESHRPLATEIGREAGARKYPFQQIVAQHCVFGDLFFQRRFKDVDFVYPLAAIGAFVEQVLVHIRYGESVGVEPVGTREDSLVKRAFVADRQRRRYARLQYPVTLDY